MFLLKQNNLDVILTCGWLCANVPICLLGGHKSRHNRAASLLGRVGIDPFLRQSDLAHLLFPGLLWLNDHVQPPRALPTIPASDSQLPSIYKHLDVWNLVIPVSDDPKLTIKNVVLFGFAFSNQRLGHWSRPWSANL